MQLPRLLITRRLPEAVHERLRIRYELTANTDDLPLARAELARALREYDALIPTITDRLDSALLESSPVRTRVIANFGAGIEHIDLVAAKRADIAVTNTPGALTEATAELALLLMLMAARRVGEGERLLRAGEWRGWTPTQLLGQDLRGKTLGLVGFGRIARETARRARALLDVRVAYHSRTRASPEDESALHATYHDSLPALLAASDIVSLHCPGGDATRHLMNAKAFACMKPTAILINTARGSVVDEPALAAALARRSIAAAGLDVYEAEPAVHGSLLELDNVVLLPHLGSATLQTRTAMGMQAADNLDAFFAGRPLPNRVA
ncbi:MAG: D-glycerate dehydrogenase [Pseudomonadota bacterium]